MTSRTFVLAAVLAVATLGPASAQTASQIHTGTEMTNDSLRTTEPPIGARRARPSKRWSTWSCGGSRSVRRTPRSSAYRSG